MFFYNLRKILYLPVFCVVLIGIWLCFAPKVYATDYYVDATGGLDTNLGTSTSQAWQTISKVNGSLFNPGDNIYFKRGEVWREQLTVPSSGTAGNPITFGAYGSGNNPLIMRTQIFSNWYEHNLLSNGGFEVYTGTPSDGISDTFTGWSNLLAQTNIIEATSSAYLGNTAVTITKNYGATSNATLRRTITGLTPSTTYYIEFYSKRDSGNYHCDVSIKDTTSGGNSYYVCDGVDPWCDGTDGIKNYPAALQTTESTWTKKSMSFTTQSNTTQLRLDMGVHYDKLGVCNWDGLYLMSGSDHSATKVWAGYDSTVLNRFGLLSGTARVPIDSTSAAPLDISTNGYFYKPTSTSYFYYRNDAGNPGSLEVGALKYGIYMTGKSYVTIDSIDVDGPGGSTSGASESYGIGIGGSSDHITVQNLTISNTAGVGIYDSTTATNIKYSNITSHDNGSTGIYMSSSGGSVVNSKSYNNCRVITDTGDCGGIGSYQGSGLTISGNEVYHNGLDNADEDFELSVVSPVNAYTITNNYVHDCIQGCLQFTAGGNGSTIAYNIIDGFGTTTATGESWGKYVGIRIGHSAGGSANTLVANNVIANGSNTNGGAQLAGSGITIMNAASTGTIVKNNIFYNNAGRDIAVNSNVTTPGVTFDYNDFYRTDYTNAWQWKGANYSSLASWQGATGQDAHSITANPAFQNTTTKNYKLTYGSPAIDTGTTVGLTSDHAGVSVPQGNAPDMGAYEFLMPLAPVSMLSPTGYTTSTEPVFSFRKSTSAPSTVSKFFVSVDSGKHRSFTLNDVPASGNGSGDYVWRDTSDVNVVYRNEQDSDPNNDEVDVFFKGLTTSDLAEGKHTWGVTTYDTGTDSYPQTTDFFIDKTAPATPSFSIAGYSTVASGAAYVIPSSMRVPSFSGTAVDSYHGETKQNPDGSKDTFDAVASGLDTLTLTIDKLKTGHLPTEGASAYESYLTKSFALTEKENSVTNGRSSPFSITLPSALVDGYYKVTVSTKDKAGNLGSGPVFFLSLNNTLSSSSNLKTTVTQMQTVPAVTAKEKEAVKENGYDVKINVRDANNKPVAGAKVTIHSRVQEAYTNKDGVAEFTGVEPGDHSVVIAYAGFEGQQNLTLSGDVKEFSVSIMVKPSKGYQVATASGVVLIVVLLIIVIILSLKLRKRARAAS